MSQSQRRRRAVSSCIPCYSKKQKCNRQYPCNHCTRRRRPELCAYVTTPAVTQGASPTSGTASDNSRPADGSERSDVEDKIPEYDGEEKMAEAFGYFDDSVSNTLGLLRQFGLEEQSSRSMPALFVQQEWQKIPSRPILDFLIQYFINELNWIGQWLHPPRFLAEYERWRNAPMLDGNAIMIPDVEFSVLVLRIAVYTSQFLPSPSYMVDSVRGVPLCEIRTKCTQIANRLAPIAARACSRGSLTRVLHLAFEALSYECEGRLSVLWSRFGDAIKAAQAVGLHRETAGPTDMDELERELRRRTMWNLVIFDHRLSRTLDRVPFLDLDFCTTDLPRMRLISDTSDPHALDAFAERLTQARLAQFWSNLRIGPQLPYDCSTAESQYEKFCTEFLPTIPAPFALEHKPWDEQPPVLTRQRQLLHFALYDHIIQNFRSLLFLDPGQVQDWPEYTQALLYKHRRILARAALGLLQSVATLHTLLGQGHTRLSLITFHTFEASVILVCLLMSETPSEAHGQIINDTLGQLYLPDPLSILIPDAGSNHCMQVLEEALSRLEMLAHGSLLAEVGAKRLSQLVARVRATRQPPSLVPSLSSGPQSTIEDSPTLLDLSQPPSSFGEPEDFEPQGVVPLDYSSWAMVNPEFFWQEPIIGGESFPLQTQGLMDLVFTHS